MGIVAVTCGNCGGKGMITAEGGETHMLYASKTTCNECDGTGSTLVSTNFNTPYKISVDISGTNDDEAWALVWKRHDDNTLEVLDFTRVEQFDTENPAYVQRTVFGQNGRWD